MLAVQAVDLFYEILGQVAGNLALTTWSISRHLSCRRDGKAISGDDCQEPFP